MKIYRYTNTDIKDWYICHGKIKGRLVWGAGTTHYKAFLDAIYG